MPHTKQHLQRDVRQRRSKYGGVSDTGVCLTTEGIEEFLGTCRVEGWRMGR